MTFARALALLLLLHSTAFGVETRYVVAHDYEYGSGATADGPNWRAITWVWRSVGDREACRRSVFSDPTARRSDPFGTPACKRARLAAATHRSPVEVLPADPACGSLTTIAFSPPDRDRLARVTGCVGAAQLDVRRMPLERGAWIFVVDVHELAGEEAPSLRHIGAYPTWAECERVRRVVRDELAKESDAEAADGSKLAAAGACLPDELLD